MKLRRRKQEPDPVDFKYEGPGPQQDMHSYKNMMLTERRWAHTDSGLRSAIGAIGVVFLCVGLYMFSIFIQRGWDGLLSLLGWR